MEINQYFASLVIGIGAIHLVWTACTQISARWNVHKNDRTQNTAVHAETTQQRNDWYVFFHCSDLYGPDTVTKSTASVKENRSHTAQKNPRLQIRAH